MKAEIIAVGTELLLGDVVNTNSAEIARMLTELGIGVYYQSVVGDNPERLSATWKTAIGRVDLVIACGGLGPTEDDLTRETLAEILGLPLEEDRRWARHLHERFARRFRGQTGTDGSTTESLPLNNLRQAMVPRGADLLPNGRGTAPGIYLVHGETTIVLLPGPPGEMRELMREQVLPRLGQQLSGDGRDAVLRSRVLRVVGVGESRAAEILEDILANQSNPTIAPLAQLQEVHFRITAHAPTIGEADTLIDGVARQLRERLGDAVYGEDKTTLEEVVGTLLVERNLTVAFAESCTGGLVSNRVTDIPGSSRYLKGSFVVYHNDLKSTVLGVDPAVIEREGAVSEATALAMAQGARTAAGSDIAVAVTGIAGPDGGSEEKPVGLTWIALTDGTGTYTRRFIISGSRREVKLRASQQALDMLRMHILKK